MQPPLLTLLHAPSNLELSEIVALYSSRCTFYRFFCLSSRSFVCFSFFAMRKIHYVFFFFKWSGDYYNDDNESLIIILASSHLPFLRSPNVTITFHLLSFFSLDIFLIRRITNALFGFNVYPFFL